MPESEVNSLRAQILILRDFMNSRILGQQRLISRMMVALLADGHILVEGPPGLAKTRAVKTLASGLEGDFQRIQFTPDLLPSDLTGVIDFAARLAEIRGESLETLANATYQNANNLFSLS